MGFRPTCLTLVPSSVPACVPVSRPDGRWADVIRAGAAVLFPIQRLEGIGLRRRGGGSFVFQARHYLRHHWS